jgi:hypothetical protein
MGVQDVPDRIDELRAYATGKSQSLSREAAAYAVETLQAQCRAIKSWRDENPRRVPVQW